MLTRRKFIESSIFTQIAFSTGVLNQLYSCSPDERSEHILIPALQKILKALMDEIIPATSNLPSASEVGGLNYIIKLLEKFPEKAGKVAIDLKAFNENCNDKFGKKFTELSSKEKESMLLAQEKFNPVFFRQIRDYTFESFYLSPQIWKLIRHEPHLSFSPAF